MAHRKKTSSQYGGHEIVGTVGDINFPEYGGGEVYKNKEGEFILEYVEPPPDDIDFDDKNARWEIFRVTLERGVPDGSLKQVAKFADWRPSDLKAAFESDNPMDRAQAYNDWAAYYGWRSMDEYPLVLDKHEVESRYETELGSGDDDEEEEEEEEDEDEEEEEDEDEED